MSAVTSAPSAKGPATVQRVAGWARVAQMAPFLLLMLPVALILGRSRVWQDITRPSVARGPWLVGEVVLSGVMTATWLWLLISLITR